MTNVCVWALLQEPNPGTNFVTGPFPCQHMLALTFIWYFAIFNTLKIYNFQNQFSKNIFYQFSLVFIL